MATALSLFSGIGGLCEGVKKVGFDIIGAVENDVSAADNYELNFPQVPLFRGDVSHFMGRAPERTIRLQQKIYVNTNRLNLLFGGPPCQGFSQIGTREVADPRNRLYLEVFRLARLLKPDLLLIENVPNMFSIGKGVFKRRISAGLQRCGYDNFAYPVLNASEFGVPQVRKRVFILATKFSLVKFPIDVFFEEAINLNWYRTTPISVWDAIGDLPKRVAPDSGIAIRYPTRRALSSYQREMRLDYSGQVYRQQEKQLHYKTIGGELSLYNHHTKEIQQRRLSLIRHLGPGDNGNALPRHFRNEKRPAKWRRFCPHRPAHTIMAQMHRDLSEWIHPHHDRWITVREALRLQSFHDGFVLRGSERQQLKQVGNAVPPLMARVPSLAALLALEEISKRRKR